MRAWEVRNKLWAGPLLLTEVGSVAQACLRGSRTRVLLRRLVALGHLPKHAGGFSEGAETRVFLWHLVALGHLLHQARVLRLQVLVRAADRVDLADVRLALRLRLISSCLIRHAPAAA